MSLFPGGSAGKESSCNTGDPVSIPGLGRSPGAGVQPRLIQGIRSGDGVGNLCNYLFIKDIKSNTRG